RDGPPLSLYHALSFAATRCARASASVTSTAPLTARLDSRLRTFTAWLGSQGGRRRGSVRAPCFSSCTNSLRNTSPLLNLSSEVPRQESPCSGSNTSRL